MLSCGRMSENHREPEVPEVEVPVVECLDGLARITLEELAINSFCEKWHPPECLFHKTKSGCRFGEKCSFAHRQVDEQPTKRSKKNDDKSAVAMLKKGDWHERGPVTDQCHDRSGQPGKRSDKKLERKSSQRRSSDARQLCCVFQDMTPPKSILQSTTNWLIQSATERLQPCPPHDERRCERSHVEFVGPAGHATSLTLLSPQPSLFPQSPDTWKLAAEGERQVCCIFMPPLQGPVSCPLPGFSKTVPVVACWPPFFLKHLSKASASALTSAPLVSPAFHSLLPLATPTPTTCITSTLPHPLVPSISTPSPLHLRRVSCASPPSA